MKKISIIIPVFNSEFHLEKCINSILSQSFTDFEIIAIDDASRDSSLQILNRFTDSDSRIHTLVHDKNKGAPTARNYGIQKAVGEFIMFIDADDELCNDALFSLYNNAIRYDSDCVKGGLLYCYNNFRYTWKNRNRSYPAGIVPHTSLKECRMLWHFKEYQTYLFKKDLILNNDCFFIKELSACQDIPFLAQALCVSNKITIIPDNIYIHRNHNLSISHKKWTIKEYESLIKGYSIASDILSGYGHKEAAKVFCSTFIDNWSRFINMPKYLPDQECYRIFDKISKFYNAKKYPLWQGKSNLWAKAFLLFILTGLYSQSMNILKVQSSTKYKIINLIGNICKRISFTIKTTLTSLNILPDNKGTKINFRGR